MEKWDVVRKCFSRLFHDVLEEFHLTDERKLKTCLQIFLLLLILLIFHSSKIR